MIPVLPRFPCAQDQVGSRDFLSRKAMRTPEDYESEISPGRAFVTKSSTLVRASP